ncbi:hypothetical protein MJG53_011255 [Ovis ammon polii x Ovis aries]|uniref:Uncharacterized protein n=1 Tax=Ovis ammon polii x Ovis aries TaxID=2918886 RepID=A0ACB9US51_9CETA|nr:hypothetical protein MJG53_011255 [Ovis ammon polii x Ovis aries]
MFFSHLLIMKVAKICRKEVKAAEAKSILGLIVVVGISSHWIFKIRSDSDAVNMRPTERRKTLVIDSDTKGEDKTQGARESSFLLQMSGLKTTFHENQKALQAKILSMMEDNKQLALRIDGAVQSASQEVTNLRAELTATNRRLAELSGGGGPGPGPGAAASASAAADSAAANMENHQHSAQGFNRLGPARIRSDIVDPVQVE